MQIQMPEQLRMMRSTGLIAGLAYMYIGGFICSTVRVYSLQHQITKFECKTEHVFILKSLSSEIHFSFIHIIRGGAVVVGLRFSSR